MKVAVAGIPGAWSSERMAESLQGAGIQSFVFSPDAIEHDLTQDRMFAGDVDLSQLDGVVVKKLGDQGSAWSRLRLHPLRALEARGVRVFSRADAIDVAMDRYRMTMGLVAAGLPIPRTIAASGRDSLQDAVDEFGDCVVKPVFTSKGRGMVRIAAGEPVPAEIDAGTQAYLVQEFVRAPGRDIGATVIGGQFVGAFYRVAADGAWMTTTSAGGRYEACNLAPDAIALAERAARAFRLDYTVVDLVETDGGFLRL